ncbi:NhaP-type Na+/H+ and K+/H+ antiporter [Kitasatospora sp. SolWspMP-SS2h]|uniref:potassium/proton antiporter n=1 Tax=Kitasatospora sp. SolWspMP-SS2h TaxID=1305729 RepID=UPI000DC03A81|nr:potassium/proton antiporter [Kitasatospora sp. SolWspMP-SS2h]RAJ36100.1 NhaP-type Na+/H+ and K+/H+ antiporter [Kitasatospora sp. SolWspMP-SS2h]
MTVDHLNTLLLESAVILLFAVVAVRISTRSGLPSLLIYLGIGVALGQNGIGISFNNAELTQVLGYAALVVILAEGGLKTSWRSIRPVVPAAAVLATLGVAVSVFVTAAGAHWLVGLEWRTALLLGAIVSSTDAAAVFSVLRMVPLPKRLTGLLEAESGFNDAPVVILVVAFAATGELDPWYVLVGTIVVELVVGGAVGYAVGKLGAYAVRRIALPSSGLYPIAVLALIVLAYAGGSLLHASGFLATYVASVILGNSKLPHGPAVRGFADGLAWIGQIGMFVVLGLLVTPTSMGAAVVPGLVAGAVLVFVARPLSVLLTMTPFRIPWQEQALLSWAGLRGAVPIVLATIPLVSGATDAQQLFNVVFILVVVFTLLQGPTLPLVARWLRIGEGDIGQDLGIESAPLEKLHGHLLSVHLAPGSRMSGVEVSELRMPEGAAVTLVVREGSSFVPDRTTVLREGDELLVVTTDEVSEAAERRLRAVDRGGKLAGWLEHAEGPSGVSRTSRRTPSPGGKPSVAGKPPLAVKPSIARKKTG